ncbi:hypothetical protein S40285_09839 [Stachybotrys chlorohalonatus IBT 40285]|uniref:Uncharacterized protein n=1 Tax=Stachybotrys chlorohalonatus (strain IBT 40285) TaxID=1283841 RepID=A0A084QU78_STAC4|nr:hypothetical protein S40285_09839 [Stachybotrys chlorohalonata IBT 40285]
MSRIRSLVVCSHSRYGARHDWQKGLSQAQDQTVIASGVLMVYGMMLTLASFTAVTLTIFKVQAGLIKLMVFMSRSWNEQWQTHPAIAQPSTLKSVPPPPKGPAHGLVRVVRKTSSSCSNARPAREM